jgi:farnesyl-diphosphate farnesyltransferase
VPDSRPELLTGLLQQVSRSFYLTLRMLPGSIRPQIGLAYLLARATDTIADTDLVSIDQRLNALEALRNAILTDPQRGSLGTRLGELATHQQLPAERTLLERVAECLALLDALGPTDQQCVRQVLGTITSGQLLDLQRFGRASRQQMVALNTDAELEDYTYRVAGCVGEFWTKMCRTHVFPQAHLNDAWLLERGTRFGKGLQLVNILRDLPADLGQGRCYLPRPSLETVGLVPQDLLEPAAEPRFRSLYHNLLAQAESHLAAGWDYTNALPWSCARVRLACAWPILIGLRTIQRLRTSNVLDGSRRVKISRADVRQVMLVTAGLYPFPGRWRGLFSKGT